MSFVLTNSLCGCSGTGSTGDHYHHCDGCIILYLYVTAIVHISYMYVQKESDCQKPKQH